MTVPLVMTPSWVYSGEFGFFFTPMIGSWNLGHQSSQCVSCGAMRGEGRGGGVRAVRGLELGVRHVGLLEAQAHRANEALVLWRLCSDRNT